MAYEKTIWKTGDIITADKLNNIEDGIKDITSFTTIDLYGLLGNTVIGTLSEMLPLMISQNISHAQKQKALTIGVQISQEEVDTLINICQQTLNSNVNYIDIFNYVVQPTYAKILYSNEQISYWSISLFIPFFDTGNSLCDVKIGLYQNAGASIFLVIGLSSYYHIPDNENS